MTKRAQYIGCQQVEAVPSTRDGHDGYYATYPDGYRVWIPKNLFDRLHLPFDGLGNPTAEMVEKFIASYEIKREEKRTIVVATLVTGATVVEGHGTASTDHSYNIGVCKAKIYDQVSQFLYLLIAFGKSGVTA